MPKYNEEKRARYVACILRGKLNDQQIANRYGLAVSTVRSLRNASIIIKKINSDSLPVVFGNKQQTYYTEEELILDLPVYHAKDLEGEELAIFKGKIKPPKE
jgi:transposase-like protein